MASQLFGPARLLAPPGRCDRQTGRRRRERAFFPIKPHGRLDLVAEAFNLFNRVNVTALNAVYGPSLTPYGTFGSAIDAASARRLQFSIDFEF